jgi:hypothetical protein
MQSGDGSDSVLALAIEQYKQIVKLEPDSVDDHLAAGPSVPAESTTSQKAEAEFKIAVKLEPEIEEAVTTLAYLYNEEGDSARAAKP